MSDLPLEDRFEPTFAGTDAEARWIAEALGPFHADRWLTDVLYRVRPGKEATVYCCRAGPETGLKRLAAKVFRPRIFRAMRNDAFYKEGRLMRGPEGKLAIKARDLRAVQKKTRRGRAIDMASWCGHEFRALLELHEAGADVPRPLACSGNVVLMEYVGDDDAAAPTLQSVRLERGEAEALLGRLLGNIATMLRCYWVHADLSAYNVLYWEGAIKIIDLPQAVDAQRHPAARELLARDVDRLCRYFQRQGVACDPAGIAWDLWMRFTKGDL